MTPLRPVFGGPADGLAFPWYTQIHLLGVGTDLGNGHTIALAPGGLRPHTVADDVNAILRDRALTVDDGDTMDVYVPVKLRTHDDIYLTGGLIVVEAWFHCPTSDLGLFYPPLAQTERVIASIAALGFVLHHGARSEVEAPR